MAAFNRRHSPLIRLLAELATASGENIEHIRCDFFRHERFDDDFSATAIHGLDAVRYLAGRPFRRVHLNSQSLDRPSEMRSCKPETTVHNAFLHVELDGGMTALFSFCPSTGAAFERYTVLTRCRTWIAETVIPGGHGVDGSGRIWEYIESRATGTRGPLPHPLDGDELYAGGYYGEMAEFIRRVREGPHDGTDLAASRDAINTALVLRNWKNNLSS